MCIFRMREEDKFHNNNNNNEKPTKKIPIDSKSGNLVFFQFPGAREIKHSDSTMSDLHGIFYFLKAFHISFPIEYLISSPCPGRQLPIIMNSLC